MNHEVHTYGFQTVSLDDHFYYDCSGCGDCCRNVKDSVMLESLDLFRLAQFLNLEMSQVVLQFTETRFLTWGFPIFLLRTTAHQDACVFLRSSRCSAQGAKPRTCRLYPLGVGPDEKKPGEWLSFLVSKKQHHFTGQHRRVSDWLDENLTPEDREFAMLDYIYTGELAKLLHRIDHRHEERILSLMLYYKYMAYDLDVDFLPQFTRNMESLKKHLKTMHRGSS